jgi:hypothetical protein
MVAASSRDDNIARLEAAPTLGSIAIWSWWKSALFFYTIVSKYHWCPGSAAEISIGIH